MIPKMLDYLLENFYEREIVVDEMMFNTEEEVKMAKYCQMYKSLVVKTAKMAAKW